MKNKTIEYELDLLSDGEIGSGIGGEINNDLVARDLLDRPIIRSTHIKGLLREQVHQISSLRGWPDSLGTWCFGTAGNEGLRGGAYFTDAVAPEETRVREIVRTALSPLGVASGTTLRTTEAVSVGTCFKGSVSIRNDAPPLVETVLRLALLSLEAVGGGRTRGGGLCLVRLPDESRTPGDLLQALDPSLKDQDLEPPTAPSSVPVSRREPEAPPTLLRLIYQATAPLCCPETPAVGTNVVRAGLGVPASAVQGAIISMLAEIDPELAQATFEDSRTRAWPLLPCALDPIDSPPIPVRVALSHRMSKLRDPKNLTYSFEDAAISAYDWRTVAKGSPLKAKDGVLLHSEGNPVTLWPASEMPHTLSSHAVHYGDQRTLFTVEALAPMLLSGWITLPPLAEEQLRKRLRENAEVVFGKSRTVRGRGVLHAEPARWEDFCGEWRKDIFVVQSPVAIPDDLACRGMRAETILDRVLQQSGWGELEELDREEGMVEVTSAAACGVRFGWNRHAQGARVKDTPMLRARRVFLPGTVFKLKNPVGAADLARILLRGVGVPAGEDIDGRAQGYGAVMPHPGTAQQSFERKAIPREAPSSAQSGRWAIGWFNASGKECGPSPSQIAAVAQGITASGDAGKAIEYLEYQRTGRPARIWQKWHAVHKDILEAMRAKPQEAKQALRTWQDLAIIHRKPEDKERND